jgi:hypothetical protein
VAITAAPPATDARPSTLQELSPMLISLINFSRIKDAELQTVTRAINRQLAEDFQPYWGFGAQLRLEGKVGAKPSGSSLAGMRGEGVLYLWDESDVDGALGYHDKNHKGIPYGFVFTKLSEQLGENWTVTLSHEVLELVGDPQANLLVQGPHPDGGKHKVFHWFEMCDAVQSETYKLDGVELSNFVLPLYFTEGNEAGSRNDFLGTLSKGQSLASFGVNPGGYIGYYDPQTGENQTHQKKGDRKAAARIKAKRGRGAGRGAMLRK